MRIALYAAGAISAPLALVALLLTIEQWRTRAATGSVLSAFFSQEVLRDIDPGSTVEIIIQRHPKCLFCEQVKDVFEQSWFARSWKLRAISLSDPWFARLSRITRPSFFLNSLLSTDISSELRLPPGARSVFLDFSDLKNAKNGGGFFVVSHIGLNLSKSEAVFYVDHFCPGLCGGGEYILLRKLDGVWLVIENRSTWLS